MHDKKLKKVSEIWNECSLVLPIGYVIPLQLTIQTY